MTAEMTRIKKGWGSFKDGVGEIFAYHTSQENPEETIFVETVKLLSIAKDKRLSRHYHKKKDEYFICVSGMFLIEFWDDGDLDVSAKPTRKVFFNEHDRVFVPAGLQHRMTGLSSNNVLLEVSTFDDPEDSYRIQKGD